MNEAATGFRRALLLTVRDEAFNAVDNALAALDRSSAERVAHSDEAIATLRNGGIDLFIVDLARDGMAHLAALEILRNDPLLSGISCVAITADSDSTPTQKAVDIGLDDLLREPLDRTVVRLSFAACLERARLREDSLQFWLTTAGDETDDHARALLDALPDAVLALRQDGAIELANAVAERTFGLNGAELIGTPISALLTRAVDDGQGTSWSIDALENQRGPALAVLRLPGGFSRPVEVLARPYQRFGRHLTACVLREVDWVAPKTPSNDADGPGRLRANAELLHQLASEVTTRLDLIGRNLNMMTDEIFGPVGVAIYKSYLSEALTGIDQARALLDGAAHPDKERRKDGGSATALRDLVLDVFARKRPGAERRRIVLESEIEPQDLCLHMPARLLTQLMDALVDFAVGSAEHGGLVTLRAQCGSDEKLLLTVHSSGCSQPASEILAAAREPTDQKTAQKPLTVAWSALRAAAKMMDGVAEIDISDGNGAMLVAMLPQRRRSDR